VRSVPFALPTDPCSPIFNMSAVSIFYYIIRLAVWLSGNALASINVVALRHTQLVPGWVTVCGRVNHFGM